MRKTVRSWLLTWNGQFVVCALLLPIPAIPISANDIPPQPTDLLPTSTETEPPGDPTPSNPASPTETPTSTLTPTDNPTEIPPPTETPTLEPTATETVTPTLVVITSTVVVSTTTTLEPTATEVPELNEALLILNIDDTLATPGGALTLSWQVSKEKLQSGALDLLLYLPSGFLPLSGSKSNFDEKTGAYIIIIQEETGWASFSIPATLPGPYPVKAVLAQPQEGQAALVLETFEQQVSEKGLTQLPLEGGEAIGMDGKVRLIVPAGAADQALDLRIHAPIPAHQPVDSLSGNPIEITANGQQDGAELHQFAQPLTLEMPFQGGRERSIFYYDPTSNKWLALPTEVDRERGVLRTQVDHLSIFDDGLNDWQMAGMPTLDNAQVSSRDGSASYSYPIWTPPGPAGLQPSLALSYNSGMVDGAVASLTQGGWVGMGWSLDVGAIERNMHGTDSTSDDTYSLVLNGVSSTILLGSDGNYHLESRNFWRIKLETNTWTVWDKEGNKYTFGKDSASRASRPHYTPASGCPKTYTELIWKWGLSEVENKFGKKLTYTHYADTRQVKLNPCEPQQTKPLDIALYPDTITYPHNRYRIVFQRGSRYDYDGSWLQDSKRVLFQRYLLDYILVQHDADGSGPGGWADVRKVDLTYAQDIFTGFTWSEGWKSIAVHSIQETGLASQTRPSTTFTYADAMHLTQVENGFGGIASYTYETTPWAEATANDDYIDTTPEDGNCPDGWHDYPTTVYCSAGKLIVDGIGYRSLGQFSVQEGGLYELYIRIKNNTGNTRSLTVKFEYNGSSGYYTVYSGSVAGYALVEQTTQLVLPMDAQHLRWIVQGQNFTIQKIETRLLLTRYRVTQQTVDGGGLDSGSSTSFEYDSPASNDPAHSQAVANETSYTDPYRSFRGHAAGRTLGPVSDGERLVSTTWYRQDDLLNGKPVGSLNMIESYHQPFESNACGNDWTCSGSTISLERFEGDQSLKLYNTDDDWNTSASRSSPMLNTQNSALLQFRVDSSANDRELRLGLESSNGDARLGVHLASNNILYAAHCIGQSCSDDQVLFPGSGEGAFQLDTWYVLLLTVDDQVGLWLRVWQHDTAYFGQEFRLDDNNLDSKTWKLTAQLKRGFLHINEYAEGKLTSFSASGFDVDYRENENLTVSEPSGYDDLLILWAPITNTLSLSFEGGSLYLGSWSHLEYQEAQQGNQQYGNLTLQEEAFWNGTDWEKYRATQIEYYPYTSTLQNLVGLPAAQVVYACSGTSCSLGEQNLQSASYTIYDTKTSYNSPPSDGKPTWSIQFACYVDGYNQCLEGYQQGGTKGYTKHKFTYDDWGNVKTSTSFTNYGSLDSNAPSGSRTAETGFDTFYGTYPITTTIPLTGTLVQQSALAYDYALGLPTMQIDPNGSVSTASYDGFGSPTVLRQAGDESGRATLSAGYFLSWQPFMIDLQQKINADDNLLPYNIRKFYDGRGRLIQQQTARATLADNACSTDADTNPDECDIVVDSWVS
jgi:hypothetical protein